MNITTSPFIPEFQEFPLVDLTEYDPITSSEIKLAHSNIEEIKKEALHRLKSLPERQRSFYLQQVTEKLNEIHDTVTRMQNVANSSFHLNNYLKNALSDVKNISANFLQETAHYKKKKESVFHLFSEIEERSSLQLSLLTGGVMGALGGTVAEKIEKKTLKTALEKGANLESQLREELKLLRQAQEELKKAKNTSFFIYQANGSDGLKNAAEKKVQEKITVVTKNHLKCKETLTASLKQETKITQRLQKSKGQILGKKTGGAIIGILTALILETLNLMNKEEIKQ